MNNYDYFEQNGCTRINNFIDSQTISVVHHYLENRVKRGEWKEIDHRFDTATKFFYYADPLIEVLLESSCGAIEEATNKKLIPTYSYVRAYKPGEKLISHVDREACEVTATINVVSNGGISPIYTQYKDNVPEEHFLNPGDAVIYKGCEVKHWRNPLTENQMTLQFMLHYVDKNGPYAEFAYDSRVACGLAPVKG
jgi:hypothetical protein